MTKTLTKKEFQELAFPIKGNEKDIEEPKMQLLPNDKGLFNGNLYSIEVKAFEDLVILERINE